MVENSLTSSKGSQDELKAAALQAFTHGIRDFLGDLGIDPAEVPCPPENYGKGTSLCPITAALRNPWSGRIEIRYPCWGLVPQDGDRDFADNMRFARAETVSELPSFRAAFQSRRCILPMIHFHQSGGKKVYRLSLKSGLHMGVAGIWEVDRQPHMPPLVTCSLITVPPNALVREIHNRMPAILAPEDYEAWLDPTRTTMQDLDHTLQSYDEDLMTMELVRDNPPAPKTPKAPGKPPKPQGGLFGT